MLAVKTLRSNTNIFRRVVRLMGNQFEISVVADNMLWAEERITAAVTEINRIEKLLSAFTDDSQVNEINRNAGVKAVKVNPEIFWLIDRSLKISGLTYGAFDITYYADRNTGSKADKVTNGSTSPVVTNQSNYQDVVLDAELMTVFLKEKGMRVSFAAHSKGYAADRAKYILQLQGVSSGVINAGGDLLTWGAQPGDEPWTIAAADPEQETQPYANLNISNMCFATSVNTDGFATISNKLYINSKKGFPVSGIKSVSVLSPSAELADAMATPIITIGLNAGLYLINQLNQIACVIIDDHHRVYTSKGISIAD
jgi:thiamine biosynthesis lipoprotein